MSEQEKTIELDGVTYVMRKANFGTAIKHTKKLGSLLDGAITSMDGKTDINFGAVLENFQKPEMAEIEKFVMDWLTVDGKPLSTDAALGDHFNGHADHYFKLVFEGVKFHFLRFLPIGQEFLQGISLEKLAAVAK